jgi:hypothetical protein
LAGVLRFAVIRLWQITMASRERAGWGAVFCRSESMMRASTSIRLTAILLAAGMLVLALPPRVSAQDDANDAPLGDVARSFRKKTAPSPDEVVIDNDNFSKVMQDAETHHATGSTMVFSLDPGGKSLRLSSSDVSCSLTFNAKTSSLLADPIMLDELPRSELAKLDGPATIEGDSMEVSIHNGTAWELREVVIGLTIIRSPDPDDAASYIGKARIVPTVVGGSSRPVQDSSKKLPDVTMLLRVKGSAAPSATALFRTQLDFALFPDQEWHWAIVRAKGVPPPAPPEATTAIQSAPAEQPPALPPDIPQSLRLTSSSATAEVAAH